MLCVMLRRIGINYLIECSLSDQSDLFLSGAIPTDDKKEKYNEKADFNFNRIFSGYLSFCFWHRRFRRHHKQKLPLDEQFLRPKLCCKKGPQLLQ